MAKVNLIDFFKYFKGTPNQTKAIEMLAEVLPESLSRDKSPWVVQYRAAEPEPEAPAGGTDGGAAMPLFLAAMEADQQQHLISLLAQAVQKYGAESAEVQADVVGKYGVTHAQ